MPTGFGTGPPEKPGGGAGADGGAVLPQGMRADQPPPNQPDDLHAIRKRYVGPKTLAVTTFSFAANQGQRFDLTGTPVNAIILTTMTGQVNGYFGDNSSQFGKAALTPHFVGSAGIAVNTEIISIPPATDYIFTLQEGAGSTATGTVIFIYQ